MNNEVRASCLDHPHGMHTKQARWCSSQDLCLVHRERKQESKELKQGENGCEFLDNNADELVFLKPLQLHSLNIRALVWFL